LVHPPVQFPHPPSFSIPEMVVEPGVGDGVGDADGPDGEPDGVGVDAGFDGLGSIELVLVVFPPHPPITLTANDAAIRIDKSFSEVLLRESLSGGA
jgi:hypothetical protein